MMARAPAEYIFWICDAQIGVVGLVLFVTDDLEAIVGGFLLRGRTWALA